MLGIVFSITAFLSIFTINGTPLHERDLETIINILQKRAVTDKTSEESSSTTDESTITITKDIIDLIQQANKNKAIAQNDNHRQRINPKSLNQFYQNRQYESNKDDKKNDRLIDRILEQLARKERKSLKKPTHQHLTPNMLIDAYKYKSDDETESDGLKDYSKIYIVLDPDALQNNKNSGDLKNLVLRILSQSLSAIDKLRQDRNEEHRYKGFLVKDRSRRFRQQSKETYGGGGGGGDDLEDDYRPKRPRNEHGGSGGGRTAIPYIRHRGDIYERDQ